MIGVLLVIYFLVMVVVLIAWIWALIDVIKADASEFTTFEGENAKIFWILIIIFLAILGVVLYAILEKRLFMKPGFSLKKPMD